MKVRLGAAVIVMLAAAWPVGSGLAEEEDKKTPIDCGDTDLRFTGERSEVECFAFNNQQIHQGDGSAQVQVKMLRARSNRTADWLVAVDFRILGSLAIRRIGIEDNVHSTFEDLSTRNWKSVAEVQGFEAAEFTSVGDDDVQDCVAFQRFVNRRYNGFSRWLVGVSCSSDGKEEAYRNLAGFTGPGG